MRLLIDAGGDVNRNSGGYPPLTHCFIYEDKVRVLLAQPCLQCAVECDGKTPEQHARDAGGLVVADMIAQEVSGGPVLSRC